MAALQEQFVQLEWELLRTSLSIGVGTSIGDTAASEGSDTGSEAILIRLLASGEYLKVLSSPIAAKLLPPPPEGADEDAVSSAAAQLATLCESTKAYLQGPVEEAGARRVQVLIVGVAALYAFVQENITGPRLDGSAPANPAMLAHPPSTPPAAATCQRVDGWARSELAVDGEEPVGKYKLPQYLLTARAVLVEGLGVLDEVKKGEEARATSFEAHLAELRARPSAGVHGAGTAPWWAARVLALQQRHLATRAASLYDPLTFLFAQTIATLQAHSGSAAHPLPPHRIAGITAHAWLEAGNMCHLYSYIATAQHCRQQAQTELGLELGMGGALGRRTVHQVDAKAQLVLSVARTRPQALDPADHTFLDPADHTFLDPADHTFLDPADHTFLDPSDASAASPSTSQAEADDTGSTSSRRVQEAGSNAEECEIHERPELEGGAGEAAAALTIPEQACVLAACLEVRKAAPLDDLTAWEMKPYVEHLEGLPALQPMVGAAAALLRARQERHRMKTRDRAFARFQALVEPQEAEAAPSRSMPGAFAVWFPPRVLLLKEWGEVLIAHGEMGQALEVFERLELWDALITCYQLLEKSAAAVEVVKARLKVQPEAGGLWCALGDLLKQDEHYHTAWRCTNARCARAQRSLARSATVRSEWAAAAEHWEAALAINPLHAEGWFALGFCTLKAGNRDRALQAFGRCVGLDPSNPEAWNNVAALCLQTQRHRSAYKALEQSLRQQTESWEIWSNFAAVAAHLGEWGSVVRAARRVLELTGGGKLEIGPLAALIANLSQAMQGCPSPTDTSAAAATGSADASAELGLFDGVPVIESLTLDEDEDEEESAGAAGAGQEQEQQRQQRPQQAGEHGSRGFSQLLLGQVLEVLKMAVASKAADKEFWGLYAEFHMGVTQDYRTALECALKQIRGMASGAWKSDRGLFEHYADASLRLCKIHSALAAEAGGEEGPAEAKAAMKELAAARMHLKSTLKMAEVNFDETPEYAQLKEYLAEVAKLEASARERTTQ